MKNTGNLIVYVSIAAVLLSAGFATSSEQDIYDIKRLTSELITSDNISESLIARCGSMALAATEYESPDGMLPVLLDLAELDVHNDYTKIIQRRLEIEAGGYSKYPDTLKRALGQVLETINLREQKAAYLEIILNDYSTSCPELASYAALNLAGLSRETFDKETANNYLARAVELDPLNLEAREVLLSAHADEGEGEAKEYDQGVA